MFALWSLAAGVQEQGLSVHDPAARFWLHRQPDDRHLCKHGRAVPVRPEITTCSVRVPNLPSCLMRKALDARDAFTSACCVVVLSLLSLLCIPKLNRLCRYGVIAPDSQYDMYWLVPDNGSTWTHDFYHIQVGGVLAESPACFATLCAARMHDVDSCLGHWTCLQQDLRCAGSVCTRATPLPACCARLVSGPVSSRHAPSAPRPAV